MPKNPIEQFFDELERELLTALKPTTPEEPQEEETAAEGSPEAPTEEVDALSVEGLALEAIRVLQKAENTDYVDEADSLMRVADRYIRLTELAIAANAML